MHYVLILCFICLALCTSVSTPQENNNKINEATALVNQLSHLMAEKPVIVDDIGNKLRELSYQNERFVANAKSSYAPVNTLMPTDPNIGLAINNVDNFLTDIEEKNVF